MSCETLECYEDIALSDKNIFDLLEGKVSIVLYPDLHKYNNIDELLGNNGACILLFEAKPHYGHWCAIIKLNERLIEFFDPYGTATTGGHPDDNLKHIPLEYAKVSNQREPFLSILMDKSPYNLSFNEIQFQRKDKKIGTCGRHCVFRIINKDLSLYKYADMMNVLCQSFKDDYDGVVTLFTI